MEKDSTQQQGKLQEIAENDFVRMVLSEISNS